jgi:peptide/nickel transport system permease protein
MDYLIRRLLAAFATIFIVASLIFLLLYLVPGDPAEILLSSGGMAPSAEAVDALRKSLKLDQPLLVQ